MQPARMVEMQMAEKDHIHILRREAEYRQPRGQTVLLAHHRRLKRKTAIKALAQAGILQLTVVAADIIEDAPILLCGDAADLTENLEDEVAPGLCYRDDETQALASIRGLKQWAKETGAKLWPNHDLPFFLAHNRFPQPLT